MANGSFLTRLKSHGRRKLFAGLLFAAPLLITGWVIAVLYRSLDRIITTLIGQTPEITYLGPLGVVLTGGLKILLTLALLYIVGALTTNILGNYFVGLWEKIVSRVPLVRFIYNTVKQILETISISSKQSFKKVVIVEFPRKGLKAIGLVTGSITGANNQKFVSVFIPTSPNPTSGMLELIPEEDVEESPLTVEEAIKLIVSGGVIVPGKLS